MSSKRVDKELLFQTAAEIDCPKRRAEFLDSACGNDSTLRDELEELLWHELAARSFLDKPAFATLESPSTDDMATFESPGSVVGRYELLRQIGAGGFAIVFLARQSEPVCRNVALKIIKPGMDSRQVLARFNAERQALALMDHPHIAKVYDGGVTESGRPYFVMELVDGRPVTEFCDARRLGVADRLRILVKICRAVQHAHQKGIIHRDLKPSNTLVAVHDGVPVPKVIDFGVAKAIDQPLTDQTVLTRFQQIIGTPGYMSPEQATFGGADVDTRSDVYPLGVMLYELMVGTLPIDIQKHHSHGYDELCRVIREVEPARPSRRLTGLGETADSVCATRCTHPASLRKVLQGDLDWIVMKCLEKDRTRRYQSAGSLADEIDRYLNHETIEARPPSAAYQFRKFAKRNKTLVAASGIVAAILVAASVISTTLAYRAIRSERVAEDSKHEAMWNLYVARQYPIVDAWKRDDFGHLEEMLEELVPREGEPDFRGWEWACLKDQCDRTFTTVSGVWPAWHPQKNILAIVADPFGRQPSVQLLTPGDATSTSTLTPIPTHIASRIRGLRWSGDGSLLAYATAEGLFVVMDATTGEAVLNLQAYTGDAKTIRVYGFDLSHDGKMLATSTYRGQIDLWDVQSAKRIKLLYDPEMWSNLSSIKFNADSTQLAVALRFGGRMTFDIETGEAFEYSRQCNENGWVSWNSLGTHFASTETQTVAIFELNKADPLQTFPHRTSAQVAWMGLNRLVSTGYDHTIRIWDIDSKQLISEHSPCRFPVTELSVSFDERYLALSGYKLSRETTSRRDSAYEVMKIVDLHELSDKATRLTSGDSREGGHQRLAWDHDGNFIVSGHVLRDNDGHHRTNLRVWDANKEELVRTQEVGLIRSLEWHRDEPTVWATTTLCEFLSWDVGTGKLNLVGKYADTNSDAGANLSVDERWLATGDGGKVNVIDTKSMKVVRSKHVINSVAFTRWSHDEQKIAVARWHRFTIWNLSSDKVLASRTADRNGDTQIADIRWGPADRVLAVGLQDGPILIVNAETLEDIAALNGHLGLVYGIDWAPDGRRIASAGGDGTVRIWDAATGHELIALEHPDGRPFHSVVWTPNGRRLAAGDNYGDVFIWGSTQIQSLPATATGLASGVIARHLAQ